MSAWHKTKDGLPDQGEYVIVACGGVVQHVTYAIEEGHWVAPSGVDDNPAPISTFTHWRLLPDPPIKQATR